MARNFAVVLDHGHCWQPAEISRNFVDCAILFARSRSANICAVQPDQEAEAKRSRNNTNILASVTSNGRCGVTGLACADLQSADSGSNPDVDVLKLSFFKHCP